MLTKKQVKKNNHETFTIVAGVVVGTYSSIYVSAVLLNLFDLRATQEAKEQVINPFGNVD